MEGLTITKEVDARGSFCPGPLMELIRNIKMAQVGDIIAVLSSDEGSKKDIPAWVTKARPGVHRHRARRRRHPLHSPQNQVTREFAIPEGKVYMKRILILGGGTGRHPRRQPACQKAQEQRSPDHGHQRQQSPYVPAWLAIRAFRPSGPAQAQPLRTRPAQRRVRLVHGKVVSLDATGAQSHSCGSTSPPARTDTARPRNRGDLTYDYLVLATGSVPHATDIPGLAEGGTPLLHRRGLLAAPRRARGVQRRAHRRGRGRTALQVSGRSSGVHLPAG